MNSNPILHHTAVQCMAVRCFRPQIVFSADEPSRPEMPLNSPARILIVEDDFLIASDMEASLSEEGFEIVGIANSAEQAFKLAETKNPLLAVMDIRLSGKRDGIDAGIELFRVHGIRCVFATAHHDEDTQAQARPAKPLAWVPKPYTMASLVKAVGKAVREVCGEDKE